ncbi:hypothetical protein FDENT_3604 [Fusarium denticulatum]|uniref:Uncharacterized protein n=1 Tax=Fusarium denticulatum TaxID=48507 RepID=A0A8H6CSV3_9HYPO|nr:hypothetical protein FDENT_3604 [Fusarium denticulatum]
MEQELRNYVSNKHKKIDYAKILADISKQKIRITDHVDAKEVQDKKKSKRNSSPDTNVAAIDARLGREPGPAVDTEYFDFDDYCAYFAVSKSWKAKFGMKDTMAQALHAFFPGDPPEEDLEIPVQYGDDLDPDYVPGAIVFERPPACRHSSRFTLKEGHRMLLWMQDDVPT